MIVKVMAAIRQSPYTYTTDNAVLHGTLITNYKVTRPFVEHNWYTTQSNVHPIGNI